MPSGWPSGGVTTTTLHRGRFQASHHHHNTQMLDTIVPLLYIDPKFLGFCIWGKANIEMAVAG